MEGYDYFSCDGNAGRESREYADCSQCGRSGATANMYRSLLIGGIFCEHCKNHIIKNEEEEYPNDPGNHKEKDFTEAY